MPGNRYSSTIRKRAQQIHEDLRGHITGAEIARMLKAEGHGQVPPRTVNLWIGNRTPLTPIVENLEHQAVRADGLDLVERMENTARGFLLLADAISARFMDAAKDLLVKNPDDAGRIADALLTITRCSIETARARENLGMARGLMPTSPIDRSAVDADARPFASLAQNFQV